MNAEIGAASAYAQLQGQLVDDHRTWLITGVAGFIGSNLLEALLKLNQRVVGLDNFSTGYQHNLDEVKTIVTEEQWRNFTLFKGDIRNVHDCRQACEGVDYVLHQAALGSVPRSLADPLTTNEVNVAGFLNMLEAARHAGIRRLVYAASSSTYGDHPGLPKVEDRIGRPLSPYAVTKYVNELYADVFARCYGFEAVGLRYFNVFGPRQDPNGAYAAVIPKWTAALLRHETVFVNGDGETSRDFCYVANAVQANLLAATSLNAGAINEVFNIAVGDRTTLNTLLAILQRSLSGLGVACQLAPQYRDFREGDVRHSQASIDKAQRALGYCPTHTLEDGVATAMPWYVRSLRGSHRL